MAKVASAIERPRVKNAGKAKSRAPRSACRSQVGDVAVEERNSNGAATRRAEVIKEKALAIGKSSKTKHLTSCAFVLVDQDQDMPCVITVTKAKARFHALVEQARRSHEPILITSRNSNCVLMGEEDFQAMQETLALLGFREPRDAISEGRKEFLQTMARRKDLEW